MAQYPSALVTTTQLPTSSGTNTLDSPDHSASHNAVNGEIIAIETTIGTNSGTSVLKNFVAGDFAAKVKNETFGTCTFIGGTVGTAKIGTCTITGGTVSGGVISSSSGTLNNMIMGSPAITGGTATGQQINAHWGTPVYATATAGGTVTCDLAVSNQHRITLGTGNVTMAFSNSTYKDGYCFMVRVLEDAVGTRVITWPAGVTGTADLTTSGSAKTDCFGFNIVGTAGTVFDGAVVFSNR